MLKYFKKQAQIKLKNTAKFLKYTRINNYIIQLKKDKQPFFGLIYNLRSIELEILKIYIKTNLANGFIRLFKSFTNTLIFFN